jgi:integral membrane protein
MAPVTTDAATPAAPDAAPATAAPEAAATPSRPHHWTVRAFRAVAIAEAFSWAGLLVGMYVKWIAEASEIGVKIFGPVHGGLVVVYVALALVVAVRQRWSLWTVFLALAATLPPFLTVLFDRWAHRSGRYEERAAA